MTDLEAWIAGYVVRLYYDLDPAVGNDVTDYLQIDPVGINGATMDFENSLNLGMSTIFLGPGFDPEVPGEYGFAIGLFKGFIDADPSVGTMSSILVTVGGDSQRVPDAGGTSILFSLGILSFGALRFRR